MAFGLGIGFIVAMFAILILTRFFFKTAFKIISIIWLVVFLASIGFALLIYADVKDMQERCPEMPPGMLLEENGTILAGIRMQITEEEQEATEDMFIASLKKYQDAYREDEFDELLEQDHCRIIIFQLSAFEGLGNVSLGDDVQITNKRIIEMLRSGSPIDELAADGISVGESNFTSAQMKGLLFAGLFAQAVEEKGPAFAIEAFNEGKARTAKDRITFKMIGWMPQSFLKGIMDRMPSGDDKE